MQELYGGAVVPRAWRCSRCGLTSSWGPGWAWLGTWRELDDGRGPREVLCPACAPADVDCNEEEDE